MNIHRKYLKNGTCMPIYGIGTWQMGGRMERDFENDDEADINAIRSAIHAGVRHIDTAEKYADGHSEVLTGRAIEVFDRRDVF
ncbi:MAG: hypothetical protein RI911_216, partial [Candidatus Parcubacteria bacterium]